MIEDQEYTADEVREELNRFEQLNVERHTECVTDTVEEMMRAIVESGNLYPNEKMYADLDLTLRERISGNRKQDFTGVFLMGVVMGTALERDIPKGSEIEEEWRENGITFPEENYE